MTDTSEAHLTGLVGDNPAGYLAALGVLKLYENEPEQPKLRWSDDVIPHAIISGVTAEGIAEQALKQFQFWAASPALNPGFGGKAAEDGKFKDETEIREYLSASAGCSHARSFAACLLAEHSMSLDRTNRKAKPTDLYFSAGQQKFLKNAKTILWECERSDIMSAMLGPWEYDSKLPTLGWDVTDDRNYALSARDPSRVKKLTNPGVEALAVVGLSTHPVFKGRFRTLTTGCSGTWKNGYYTWMLWHHPVNLSTAEILLGQATPSGSDIDSVGMCFQAWGLSVVFRSRIVRSDDGGYGTFAHPDIIWQRAGIQ